MQLSHRIALTGVTALGAAAGPALAQTMDVTVTIPRLSVAEYHKPYVAIWIEGALLCGPQWPWRSERATCSRLR